LGNVLGGVLESAVVFGNVFPVIFGVGVFGCAVTVGNVVGVEVFWCFSPVIFAVVFGVETCAWGSAVLAGDLWTTNCISKIERVRKRRTLVNQVINFGAIPGLCK
jgi:hypothetical protein